MSGYITKSLQPEIELLEKIDDMNNGEYTDEARDALAYDLTIAHDNSIETLDRYAKAVKFAESQIDMIDAEISRLKKRQARFKAMQYSVEGYIQDYLELSGQRKIEAGTFTLSLIKSTALIIDDEALIPDKFKHSIITTKIDKNELKSALKLESIEGVRLEDRDNLQIK
jgi:hypothetical protein